MNVQFLINENGEKIASVVPIEDWKRIEKDLKRINIDYWNQLPEHLKMSTEIE